MSDKLLTPRKILEALARWGRSEEEAKEAQEALIKGLQDDGIQLLMACGHCGNDWMPGMDEELWTCEQAAEPGHLVCFECREGRVECPDKRPN